MRLFGKMLAALAVVATVAAASGTFAQSTTTAVLVTAPALSGYPSFAGNRTLFCDISNVANGGVVSTDILAYNGEVLFSSGPVEVAGQTGTAFSDQGTGTGVSCRFRVTGTANQWRGVAVYDNGSDYTMAILAQ